MAGQAWTATSHAVDAGRRCQLGNMFDICCPRTAVTDSAGWPEAATDRACQ
jgi:hypothetical protein